MLPVTDVPARRDISHSAHRRTIVTVVSAAAVVLILTAGTQIFDATFYAVANATTAAQSA